MIHQNFLFLSKFHQTSCFRRSSQERAMSPRRSTRIRSRSRSSYYDGSDDETTVNRQTPETKKPKVTATKKTIAKKAAVPKSKVVSSQNRVEFAMTSVLPHDSSLENAVRHNSVHQMTISRRDSSPTTSKECSISSSKSQILIRLPIQQTTEPKVSAPRKVTFFLASPKASFVTEPPKTAVDTIRPKAAVVPAPPKVTVLPAQQKLTFVPIPPKAAVVQASPKAAVVPIQPKATVVRAPPKAAAVPIQPKATLFLVPPKAKPAQAVRVLSTAPKVQPTPATCNESLPTVSFFRPIVSSTPVGTINSPIPVVVINKNELAAMKKEILDLKASNAKLSSQINLKGEVGQLRGEIKLKDEKISAMEVEMKAMNEQFGKSKQCRNTNQRFISVFVPELKLQQLEHNVLGILQTVQQSAQRIRRDFKEARQQ